MFAKNKVSQSMLDAVNSVLVEDEKKRLINDAEIDETGFHKAAHAARKAGQSHFEFQGKKYPVTSKSHKEAIEMDEASEKVPTATGMKVYGSSYGNSMKARKDQTKSSVDDIHKGPSKSDIEKTGKDDDLEYKRTTPSMKKQYATHAGKYFSAMNKGDHRKTDKESPRYKNEEYSFASKLLNHITENKAASPEDIFTDNNLGEEEMTDKQMKKREKIVMSMKKGLAGFKQRYGKNYKNVMYATATKQAMKEDSSDEWNGSYDFVLNEKEEVEIDEWTGEKLDELSKSTLDNYVKRANASQTAAGKGMGAHHGLYGDGNYKEYAKHQRIHGKRAVGRGLAMKRGIDPFQEEVEIEEGDAQYKKDVPMKKMSDVIDRKKTVKSLMKGRQYFGTGKMKEEVELDEMDKSQKSQERHGDYPLGLKNKDVNMAKANTSKKVKKDTLKLLNKAFNKEEVELDEKNDAHNYAAHYEDPKTGEWTGMKLMTAKDDQDAIKQAHANCEDGCRLSKVERHMTVKEDVEISKDKSAHKITTDMLSGRQPGGKLNSFKNFKVNLTVAGEEDIPKEMDKGEDTKEEQKITTNPGPVEVKFDDKYGHPTPQSHFSSQERITSEEVELTEGALEQFLSQKGIEMKNLSYGSKIAYSKSNEFKKWKQNHQMEATEIPFEGPYEKNKGDEKGNIKDKSGATHTPMSRARDLARQAMKKVKTETMMGKISN